MPINSYSQTKSHILKPSSDALWLRPSETTPGWEVFLQQQHGLFAILCASNANQRTRLYPLSSLQGFLCFCGMMTCQKPSLCILFWWERSKTFINPHVLHYGVPLASSQGRNASFWGPPLANSRRPPERLYDQRCGLPFSQVFAHHILYHRFSCYCRSDSD